MKTVEKLIIMWGILDLAAIGWYAGRKILDGQIPFYSDFVSAQEITLSFGAPMPLQIASVSLFFYISLLFSGAKYLQKPSSPDLNAAPLYKEVAGLVGDKASPYLEEVNAPDFDAASPECARFLSQHEKVLKILHQATSLPQWHFHFELEKLIDMNGISITHFKKFAFLLNMEARYFARQGKFDNSMESLAAIQKMAMHVYRYPGSLLNCVYARGLEMWSFKGLENVLYDFQGKHGCPKFYPYAVDRPQTEDILQAIEMEEAFSVAYTLKGNNSLLEEILIWDLWSRDPYGLYWYEKPLGWVLDRLYNLFLYQSDMHYYHYIMHQMKLLTHADCPEALSRAHGLTEQSDKGIRDVVGLGTFIEPADYFKFTYCIYAYRRIAATAFAATAFYGDTGKYPDNIDDLTPKYLAKIPVDPFDKNGGPIRLQVHGSGILIYSVGEDQHDDGGRAQEKSSENFDIVFFMGEKHAKEKSIFEFHEEDVS